MNLRIIRLSVSIGIVRRACDGEPFSLSKNRHGRDAIFLLGAKGGAAFLLLSVPHLHLCREGHRLPEMTDSLVGHHHHGDAIPLTEVEGP